MTSESPLAPYLDTTFKVFIHDSTLAKQVMAALLKMGFRSLIPVKVKPNHLQAMRQLFGELKGFDGLILVNHPPQKLKDPSGHTYDDYTFGEFYRGVGSFNQSQRVDTSQLLGHCLPVFISAQDRDIRMKIIQELFSLGIGAAFMLSVQPLGLSWEDQVEDRLRELHDYLAEYFGQRDHKLAQFKDYQDAAELRQKRSQADQIMAEVTKLKEIGEYDKAVALCRQVIDILPSDPEAYLEGGRLLVKRKKYPPAMQMFRDAESVAQDLPTPNQEIANLRVIQVKEHVAQRQAAGQQVDAELVRGYLGEAVANFESAIKKTDRISTVQGDDQDDKRREAAAGIAENILTLELAEALGPADPLVRQLNGLAQKTLQDKVKGEGVLQPKYLAQFGLMAFFDGDLDEALQLLMKACRYQAFAEDAHKKLNYIGTQLRQQGRLEQAIEVYQTLLSLRPSFKGVVLFNLAVARQTRLTQIKDLKSPQATTIRWEATSTVAQAIYVDPLLPQDANFYVNRVIAPALKDAMRLYDEVEARAQASLSPTDQACRAARQKLDDLLRLKKDREALHYLFGLTSTLKPFFLEFDRHASERIAGFASQIVPVLTKNPQPKMQVFAKVLGVLVERGKRAAQATEQTTTHPAFKRVAQALELGDQALATFELTQVLMAKPDMLVAPEFQADATLRNLCGEIKTKLAGVDLSRFTA